MKFSHAFFEKNSLVLLIGILVVVSIGGLVEIAPLFFIGSTIEKVQGMRPYSPLELAGRNIYIREGCWYCHTQQVRQVRTDLGLGPVSQPGDYAFDPVGLAGARRIGPDLAHQASREDTGSAAWVRAHLADPRADHEWSVMPSFRYLTEEELTALSVYVSGLE